MARALIQRLVGNVRQVGVDMLTVAAIPIPTNDGFKISSVEWTLSGLETEIWAAGGGTLFNASMSAGDGRDEPTSVLGIDNKSVIDEFQLVVFQTAAGMLQIETQRHWIAPLNFIVAAHFLFIAFDSSGAADRLNLRYRVNYSTTKLTAIEQLVART